MRRLAVIGPVLAVAALFATVLTGRFHTYHGNPTGFVLFGQRFARYTHPPRGAVILSPYGYDGQFFYLQAKDPLVLDDSTVAGFRGANEAFRLQRMAYPALAYVLAAGQRGALPWSLLLLNASLVLLLTGAFAVFAQRRGWSGWWALSVGLAAGFLTGTLRDLSDPLAVASLLGGLMTWRAGRRRWAAALLTIAVLAREPMLLALVAVALEAAFGAWRARAERGAARRILLEAAPVVVLPALAFLGWQAYVDARYGANVAGTSLAFLPPFQGVVDELRHAVHDPSARNTAWELAYLGVMGAAIAIAVAGAWRVTAEGVAAALLGLTLLVLVFGDPWSYTRLSAPMFAALLLDSLERRRGWALAVCAAAAALTVVAPFAPWLKAA